MATALDSKNAEMAKRLKYTKEILTHMLNGTNVPQSNIGASEDIGGVMGASQKGGWNRNWGWSNKSKHYLLLIFLYISFEGND